MWSMRSIRISESCWKNTVLISSPGYGARYVACKMGDYSELEFGLG